MLLLMLAVVSCREEVTEIAPWQLVTTNNYEVTARDKESSYPNHRKRKRSKTPQQIRRFIPARLLGNIQRGY